MSGSKGLFDVHHGTIVQPGRRLMAHVPIGFVRRKVAGGGRKAVGQSLNLTSMIDFLMVVVIFLLSTFSVSGEAAVPKEVKLPSAKNVQEMLFAPLVGVAGKDVYVDSKPAGTIIEAIDAMERGATAYPVKLGDLETKLKFMKETWKSTHPADAPFPGMVVLQLDENLPAFVVKSVFYTCALSGYANISFLVNKKGKQGDSAAPAEGGAPQ
jgi:biopolymer transport protein ExbD